MELKTAAVSLVVVVAAVCLSFVHAQRGSPAPPVAYGGTCAYTTDCTTETGIVCNYDVKQCLCDVFLVRSADGRECIKDIGAPCTSQEECTLQFTHQNSRTCGATRVCECTGNGDCGDGHVKAPDADEDLSNADPTRGHPSTPGIIGAPPRTPVSARPTIRTAGVFGAGPKSGTSTIVASSSLLLLAAVICKANN